MYSQTLNGNWLLRQRGTEDWLQASVPGGVHIDLLADGRIANPFYGDNEAGVQWVAEKDWEYRRYFYPTAQLLAQEKVFLVCKGLDTLADVRLNGNILGLAANMFQTWQWEVKGLLKEGENRLDILFHSPAAYARQRQRIHPVPGNTGATIIAWQHLRKTPSHFGWDWSPRLLCMGIRKEIQLEGRSGAWLRDIRFEQQHEDGMVMLTAQVQCHLGVAADATGKEIQRTLRFHVAAPDRQIWQADAPAREQQSIPVMITNPQLWWPNGLGEQALYHVEIELIEEDRALGEARSVDSWIAFLGLRTIELRQEAVKGEPPGSKSFQFVVNGIPVFCKGANWVPANAFPTQVANEQGEHLVRSAAEAHQNMLRVWGCGYYESDFFYDLCDHYGILVWQDFQFACGAYPLDEAAYVESACAEVTENVRRLRHHACLALWCGNNEMELMARMSGWVVNNRALRKAYEHFFYQKLPGLLAAEDPGRAYWPSSPGSGEAVNEPNSEQRGDAHLWEVYHYFKQPAFYRTQNPRFASEFGMQSLPASETIAAFAAEADQRLNSRVMASHQRANAGNARLVWYLAQRFRLPRRFEDLIYLSQVFQAEAMRMGIEHWRRHPEHTGGALYWQLDDCWPAISWSSIDYNGRWKALQYAAQRFFAPVLLSVAEESNRGQRKAAMWVSNDHQEVFQGRLHWTLETIDGEVLKGGDQTILSEPSSASCVLRLDFAQNKKRIDWRKTVVVTELFEGEVILSRSVSTFCAEKDMALRDPDLQAQVDIVDGRLQIRLSTRRLARFIEIKLGSTNLVFSDNYFDLPANRTAVVDCALPNGWDLEFAQAALQERSLAEVGPVYTRLAARVKAGVAWIECAAKSLALLAMTLLGK
jgi:beta-mannosidase